MARQLFCAAALFACSQTLFCVESSDKTAETVPQSASRFPFPEKLTYRIEWRMVTAGQANLEYNRSSPGHWGINLDLESTGVVNRLYRVQDKYRVQSDDRFCPSLATLDAQEGKKHNQSRLSFDSTAHTLHFEEQDFIKNRNEKLEVPIVTCTREVAGALASLGQMYLEPGKTTTIRSQTARNWRRPKWKLRQRRRSTSMARPSSTVRYEAFLFDNVLYKRKGRLFIWITDDPERTPVQFRVQLGFPIGTVSLELEKQQRL